MANPPALRVRRLIVAASLALACQAVVAGLGPAVSASAATAGPTRSAGSGSGSPAVLSAGQALAQARKTGQPVAVPSLTSPTSQTTANPNGSLTLRESLMPVRAWRDGSWQPLSATLVKTGGGRLRPRLAAAPLSLSDGGTGPLAVLTANLRTLTLTWPGTLPAPAISGATATYADVLPGVDLLMTATTLGGVAETLVIDNAAAAANPALASLQLGLHASGLTLALSPAGQLSAAAGPGARPLITSPPVQMWDSAPPPAGMATATGPGGVTVIAESGLPADSSATTPGAGAHVTRVPASLSGSTLTLAPPASALTGPDVTYPVYIDPTYDNSAGSKATNWTQVDSGFPTTTYWNETSALQVGYCWWPGCDTPGDELGVARSFFQLPLSSDLDGADIGNADIYVDDQWAADGCTAEPTDLYTTGSISSATTWDNQPAWDTLVEQESFAFGGGSGCGYYAADVAWGTGSAATGGTSSTELAAIVASDVDRASPYTSQTFGLMAPDESDNLQWKQFASGAANITMTITYDQPPAAPASLQIAQASPAGCQTSQATAAAIGDDDVTFTADTSDPHTTDGMDTTFDIYNAGGTLADSVTNIATSDGSGIASDTLTAAQMQDLNSDGATQAYTYYWQAQSTNTYGHAGPWSAACWFTYNPTGPAAPTVSITNSSGAEVTTVPYGSTFNVVISAPSGCGGSDPCPTSYTYQIGAAAPGTLNAGSGSVQLTMNQVGLTGVTVTGFADGNPGMPYETQLTGTFPTAVSYYGYFAGGNYPSLLTLTGASTSTPALLLSPGTGNGTLGPAVDIGSLGNGINVGNHSDGPADWKGDIITQGNFLTTANGGGDITSNIQDVLFYNPSTTAGGIIAGTDSAATLPGVSDDTALIGSGQLQNCNLDNPAQPNDNGITPASQLVDAGNASGIGTGTDDLIGIAGNAASNDFELDIYTNGLYQNTATDGGYGYTATLAITSPDTNSWGDYSLAAVQAGSDPNGSPDPADVTLFALDTTNGQLYQATVNALTASSAGCMGYTEPPLTWTQVSTPWGNTPPALASADVNNAGQTELWTMTGSAATAYTLSGTASAGTLALTADSVTSPVVPGHDWPLTDGQVAAQDGASPPVSAADLTGGDTLTLEGSAGWDTQSADAYFGGNLSLNGSSYLISSAAVLNPYSSFTISAWVNPAVLGGTVFSLNGTDDSSVEVSSTTNEHWSIGANTGGTTADSYASMPGGTAQAGAWTDLTLTYDTAGNLDLLELYADGSEVASLYAPPPAVSGDFVLGASQSDGSYGGFFTGQLADVQAWDSLTITPSTVTGISGAPATFDPLTGSQDLYASGTTGTEYQDSLSPATGVWSGWASMGGAITGGTAALYNPDTGTEQVFGVGTTDSVYTDSWSAAGSWSGWYDMGGAFTGTPAVLYDPAGGDVEVYATSASGNLEESYWISSENKWSGWNNLGGDLTASPAAVYNPAIGGVQVFGVGTTDSMYADSWTPASGWSGWYDMGGAFTGTPAVLYDPASSNVEVYATSTKNVPEEDYWVRSTGKWSGWNNLGGGLSTNPAAVYNPKTNSVEVFGAGTGTTPTVYADTWTPGIGWSGWTNLGGAFTSSPAAVYNPNTDSVEIFGIGTTDEVYEDSSTSGSTWSGWSSLGSATFSNL